MTERAPRAAVPEHVPIVIEFLLDQTSSMTEHAYQAISGFNDFLDGQRKQDGLCLLTLTKFSTTDRHTPYTDIDVRSVPDLTSKTFIPSGMTNLNDAIIARLAALENRLKEWDVRPKTLFVVLTDGEENASVTSTPVTKNAILRAIETGTTCVYLGAHEKALVAAAALGFQPGNVRRFGGAQMRETMQTLGASTVAYRASTASSTNDFFASR
jgi:hypothetical protein